MLTAHSETELRAACGRLADMIEARPGTKTWTDENAIETLRAFATTADLAGLGAWTYHYAGGGRTPYGVGTPIYKAFSFLQGARVRVGTFRVTAPIAHQYWPGEYAGYTRAGTIAPGLYPIVFDSRGAAVALVTLKGEDHFWNRIGAHGSMRVTKIEERISYPLAAEYYQDARKVAA